MRKKAVAFAFMLGISASCFSQEMKVSRFAISDRVATLSKPLQGKRITQAGVEKMLSSSLSYCSYTGCTTLPVHLLSIEAKRLDAEKVLVKWETGLEVNNKGFDIERSLSSGNAFSKVGFVAASLMNAAKNEYAFNDANDFEGTSYYRLKQFDKDNRFVYSKVVSVNGYKTGEHLNIFPNPSRGIISIKLMINKATDADIKVFDLAGRIIRQQTLRYNKGINVNTLDMSSAAKGTYTLKIYRKGEKEMTMKFVII